MKCPHCSSENPDGTRYCGFCATPLLPVEDAHPSQTQSYEGLYQDLPRGSLFAGRYEVIEELGSGGMGKVYKVYDKKIKDVVALKLIRPELAVKPKTLERFREEIRLARRITHKNVCRMHDINEEGGSPYITMEYVMGEDLKSVIRMMGRLSAAQTVDIGLQIAAGLAEAHRLGIVHRDLKPRNIMIDREGNARIMDFGLARSLEEKGITAGKAMIGTPEYMSPEQVEGKPADDRSDLYSFGVILFEMATGKVPFDGDSALSIAVKHKTERPADPRKLNPQLPDSLARLILKCLEKDPGKRYASAEELRAELEEIGKEYPTDEKVLPRKRPSVLSSLTGPLRLKRVFITAFGILAVAALAMVIWRLMARRPTGLPPPVRPSIAVLYFKNNTGNKELDFLRDALADNLISDLRGATGQITVLSEDVIKSVLSKLGLGEAAGYSTEDLEAVTAKTRAAYILTASYSEAGDRLQINYRLIEAEKKGLVGSGSVQRREKDYVQLTTELAGKVLSDLRLPEVSRVSNPTTISLAALKLYQLGRRAETRYKATKDIQDFNQAADFFTRALREEPRYALAYVGLGDLHQSLYINSQKREDFAKTLYYYKQAFEVEPNSAETNAGLGWAYFLRGENDKAYDHFKRAFESAPENPDINANLGSFLRSVGLPEQAVRFYTKAIDRGGYYSAAGAPGESSVEVYRLRASCYERMGELENAVADAKRFLEMEPESIGAQLFYARMLISQKNFPLAETEIAVIEKVAPGNRNLGYTKALLFAARGEKEKALPLIEEAKKDPFFYSYLLSRVYAPCGLKDEAIDIITLGIEQGFEKLQDYFYEYPFLLNSYFFDNLRSDPRFIKIVGQQKKKYEENLKKYGGL